MTTRQFFEAARILYGRADMNNDRMIKKAEFKDLYKKVHPTSDWRRWNQNTWNMMFDQYDSDNDGIITWTEFWYLSQWRVELKKDNTPAETEKVNFPIEGRLALMIAEAKLERSTEYWGDMDPIASVSYN